MFSLHPQLQQDCFEVGRFELSLLLLMNDSRYPWLILVPCRAGVREVYELAMPDRLQLARESGLLAESLARGYGAHKMNIAALGNVVEQLHVHHIVRYRDDEAWPAPVWGRGTARPYGPAQRETMLERLCAILPDGFRSGPSHA